MDNLFEEKLQTNLDILPDAEPIKSVLEFEYQLNLLAEMLLMQLSNIEIEYLKIRSNLLIAEDKHRLQEFESVVNKVDNLLEICLTSVSNVKDENRRSEFSEIVNQSVKRFYNRLEDKLPRKNNTL
jgi:hypothetical protein